MSSAGFTPAQESDIFNTRSTNRPGPQPGTRPNGCLSGTEVRQFYESLLQDGEQGQNRRSDRRARRRRTRVRAAETLHVQTSEESGRSRDAGISERTAELMGLRFLRCAHEGDLPGLRDLISKGVDINYQDSFFWTAVMCASWSGQRAAVKFLLQSGAAWVGVVDVQGRDARDLAARAGRADVLEELDSFGTRAETESRTENRAPVEVRWCDTCSSSFSGSRASHWSSTLHQFSLPHPPPAPHYCLPSSANSFKMMVSCGWTPGSGLGPEQDGPRRPVATVLKRDQAGLGYGRARKPKVTHFRARDCEAVRPAGEVQRGRQVGREGEPRGGVWEQNWERDFRTSFYL